MAFVLSLAVVALAALQSGASAAAPGAAKPIPGEYLRAGAGFACVVTADKGEDVAAKALNGCLHYGPLAIGSQRGQMEAILGKSAMQAVSGNGSEAFVYPLRTRPGASGLSTYAALEFDARGKVKSVQVSGDPLAASTWAFSSVQLGDDVSVVERTLGRPLQVSTVPDTGAELWAYQPWTFSLEIKDRKVVSIRLDAES